MGPRVIAVGLPRTGNTSLKKAFETLGFHRVLHVSTLLEEPELLEKWMAALNNAGEGVDLVSLVDSYDAVVGFPACLFLTELMAAFPTAKVILTVRDPSEWYVAPYIISIFSEI